MVYDSSFEAKRTSSIDWYLRDFGRANIEPITNIFVRQPTLRLEMPSVDLRLSTGTLHQQFDHGLIHHLTALMRPGKWSKSRAAQAVQGHSVS